MGAPDPDDGRRPIRFSLLELIVFLLLVTALQGGITVLLEWRSAGSGDEIGRAISGFVGWSSKGSIARSPAVQLPLFIVSITVALLGSAWGVWTANRLKVTTSAPRAGLMALGALWVAMLPVAVTSLLTLPFVLEGHGIVTVAVLLFSWAVVVGANTFSVHLYHKMRRDELARREDERLGPLPPKAAPVPAPASAPDTPEWAVDGEVTVEGPDIEAETDPADDD